MNPNDLPMGLKKQYRKKIRSNPSMVPWANDPNVKLIGHYTTENYRREVFENPGVAAVEMKRILDEYNRARGRMTAIQVLGPLGPGDRLADNDGPVFVTGSGARRTVMQHPRFELLPGTEDEDEDEPELIGWVKADGRRIPTYIVDDPYDVAPREKEGAYGYKCRRLVDLMNDAISWHRITSLYFTHELAKDRSHSCFIPNDQTGRRSCPDRPIPQEPELSIQEPKLSGVMCTGCNLAVSECSGNYLSCVSTTHYPVPDRFVDRQVSQEAWNKLKEADRRLQAPYPDDVAEAGY